MKPQKYLQFLMLGLLLIFLITCQKETSEVPDTIPPAEVTNLAAIAESGMITLTWTDPSDADFQKVEIAYLSNTIEVNKDVQTKEITGLTNGTSYTFTVKTVDDSGNKTNGVQITGMPVSPPILSWHNPMLGSSPPSTGVVYTSQQFTNVGNSGTITFISRLIKLSDNSIIAEKTKSFNIQSNVRYNIKAICNGSASYTTCTFSCSSALYYKIEIVSLIDNKEITYSVGVTCQSYWSNCAGFYTYVYNKTVWNSLSFTDLIIEQL